MKSRQALHRTHPGCESHAVYITYCGAFTYALRPSGLSGDRILILLCFGRLRTANAFTCDRCVHVRNRYCRNNYISRLAFAFHRTAYRERLETVSQTLGVIDKLRSHKPKRYNRKSSLPFGRTTPTLSALVMSPYTDINHYNLNSRSNTPVNSCPGTPDILSGNEGDSEDPDVTLVKSKKKKSKGKQKYGTVESKDTPYSKVDQSPRGSHYYPPSIGASPQTSTPLRKGGDSNSEEDAATTLHQKATHAAKVLKTAVMHDARNIRGHSDDNLRGLVWSVTSAHEAKHLARSIFTAFQNRRRNYLIPSDFHPAFKTHEETLAAFRVFDTDNNGDLSKAEIKTTVLKVYKERRFLSRSMRDVGVALATLDHILFFFALVVLFFISLSVFNVSVGNSLTSVYSLGIAGSFIFKTSASNAFDAIMFLFVTQ